MVPPLLSRLFPPGVESVSVAEFMAAALYDPEHGYYTRHIRTVGRGGDFSTGPAISGLWGRALGRWVLARRLPGRPNHLIEIGGGTGETAYHLLKALGWWRRWRWGFRYHLVEISPPLQALQEQRLRGLPVAWHRTVEEALGAAGGRALLFSNELVDAFPCEQFVRRGASWLQVRLRLDGGELREMEAPVPALPASSAFRADAAEGQRIEVHPSYREWLRAWRPGWKEGALLTVDYGVADRRRLHGTLRAYAHHQVLEGSACYGAPGKRDLTADVDFNDLREWGAELGLNNSPPETQAAFLARWAPPARADDPAARALLDPEGMGGAFQVLEQTPSTPEGSQPLAGG